MRIFKYNEYPSGVKTVTEEDIINDYYPTWCDLMKKANKEQMISEKLCIEDWVIIHWAWKDSSD